MQESELSFLKDLVDIWRGDKPDDADEAPVRATSVLELNSDDEAEAKKADKGPAGPAITMELESDDEETAAPEAEIELPKAMLAEELADEADAKADEDDPERLPQDGPPYPQLPPKGNQEPSDARKKVLAKVKQQASEAIARGDINKALDRYTEAIRTE